MLRVRLQFSDELLSLFCRQGQHVKYPSLIDGTHGLFLKYTIQNKTHIAMSDADEKHAKFILRQYTLKNGVSQKQDSESYREYDKLFRRIFQHMKIGEKDPL